MACLPLLHKYQFFFKDPPSEFRNLLLDMKLLSIWPRSLSLLWSHTQTVKSIYQSNRGDLFLQTPVQTPDVSFSEGDGATTKDTIAITIRRDATGSPGFAVAGEFDSRLLQPFFCRLSGREYRIKFTIPCIFLWNSRIEGGIKSIAYCRRCEWREPRGHLHLIHHERRSGRCGGKDDGEDSFTY